MAIVHIGFFVIVVLYAYVWNDFYDIENFLFWLTLTASAAVVVVW